MTALVFAVGASVSYALASILQHRALQVERLPGGRRWPAVLRRPGWWAGLGADLGGVALEGAALVRGSLVMVQAVTAFSLPMAIAMQEPRSRSRMGIATLAWLVVVVAGLAAFVTVAPAGAPRLAQSASGVRWAGVLVVAGFGGATMVLADVRRSGRGRAAGAGAGLLLTTSAALAQRALFDLGHGVVAVLSSWPLYALGGTAPLTLWAAQVALSGDLTQSLPALTVVPAVSALPVSWAVWDRQPPGVARLSLLTLATAAMTIGTLQVSAGHAGSGRPAPHRAEQKTHG